MKLSRRFGLGAALAVLPLIGVLVYCFGQLQDLARSNDRIAARQLVGSQLASGVIPRLTGLEEYQLKYAVSGDAGYATKYRETQEATRETIAQVASVEEMTAAEEEVLAELTSAWAALVDGGGPFADEAAAESNTAALTHLRELTTTLQERIQDSAMKETMAARKVRRQTREAAIWISAIALVVSTVLLLWSVRSLRTRLADFTEATMMVSKGSFTYRMAVDGNDELAQVAYSFNEMVGALSQLERMKEDFVSSVSHELRTPIVAMLETNQLLLDQIPGSLNPKQVRMLKLNTQAAQRLSKMLGDLLDISRVKAGIRYRMSTQDLGKLIHSATSELEALALERGIDVVVKATDGVQARCDPDRVIQVVQSLVENALKHTPRGGLVAVDLEVVVAGQRLPTGKFPRSDRGSHYALLSVEDNGVGIAPEDRQRVFEKFFRRKGRPADAGVGLGLAISKEIVAAHRGVIWVEESRFGGAAFYVAIPQVPGARRGPTGSRRSVARR